MVNPAAKELEALSHKFKFHPLDIEDCLLPAQRPKLDEYDHYLFLTLTFPYYEAGRREISASEVAFFIGPDYLVTITDGRLTPLLKFFEQCQLNDSFRQKYLSDSPTFLLYEIINRLQLYCYPILDHVSEDIGVIQKTIFDGRERKMINEILIIKRNIVSLRKILQAHKNILRKLIGKSDKYFIPQSIHIYFNNILEQTKDIWDILENLNETIIALHSTNESLITFRLNDTIKTLTTISVVLLSINIIVGIFTMNIKGMPLVNHPAGFWIVLSIIFVFFFTLTTVLKKKKLL